MEYFIVQIHSLIKLRSRVLPSSIWYLMNIKTTEHQTLIVKFNQRWWKRSSIPCILNSITKIWFLVICLDHSLKNLEYFLISLYIFFFFLLNVNVFISWPALISFPFHIVSSSFVYVTPVKLFCHFDMLKFVSTYSENVCVTFYRSL